MKKLDDLRNNIVGVILDTEDEKLLHEISKLIEASQSANTKKLSKKQIEILLSKKLK